MYLCFALDVGKFEWQAVLLVSSIKKYCIEFDQVVVGVAPDATSWIDARVIDFLDRNDCKVFELPDRREYFDPDYRHANKVLTPYQMAQTEDLFTQSNTVLCVDTDVLFCKGFETQNFLEGALVAGCLAKGSPWKSKFHEQWPRVFQSLGLDVYVELERAQNPVYLNSGFVAFQSGTKALGGKRLNLASAWLDFAMRLDVILTEEQARPWVDQVALGVLATLLSKKEVKVLGPKWNSGIATFKKRGWSGINVLHYHGGGSVRHLIDLIGRAKIAEILSIGPGEMSFAEFESVVTASRKRHDAFIRPYRRQQISLRR